MRVIKRNVPGGVFLLLLLLFCSKTPEFFFHTHYAHDTNVQRKRESPSRVCTRIRSFVIRFVIHRAQGYIIMMGAWFE